MRYVHHATAVRRLRQIADDCSKVNFPGDDPLVVAVYTFGPILDNTEALDAVDIVLVLDESVGELSWGAEPQWTIGIVERLRLNKAPVRWYWRPAVWPVWNHLIRRPLRIWSLDGVEERALTALTEGGAQELRLADPTPQELREETAMELAVAQSHLRQTQEQYWDREWRRAHKGLGVYPENHLWNAVWGYLDLLDAQRRLTS